jgi:hypothetical protein
LVFFMVFFARQWSAFKHGEPDHRRRYPNGQCNGLGPNGLGQGKRPDLYSVRRHPASRAVLLLLLAGLTCCRSSTFFWETEDLAPGVYHHSVTLAEGPWAIHVLEVDLPTAWRAGIRLRTARAEPTAVEGLELTSAMATRVNAIAGVNGDMYTDGHPAQTLGLQISRGGLLARPQRKSAFTITADGKPMVAVFRFEAALMTASGKLLPIAAFNREPGADELTYYNRYGQAGRDSVRAAIGFQLQSLGKHSVINDTLVARVLQVRRRSWPLKLAEGQWLVAAGAEFPDARAIAAGDTVRLICSIPPSRGRLEEAIGGGPRIIRDGRVSIEFEEEGLASSLERNPRTAVGYTQDEKTLFLVTVDGRQPGYSVGMSLLELADLMSHKLADFTRAHRNAYQALNLDGGGSSTMVVRRDVVNRPSEPTGERQVANSLLLVAVPEEVRGSL